MGQDAAGQNEIALEVFQVDLKRVDGKHVEISAHRGSSISPPVGAGVVSVCWLQS